MLDSAAGLDSADTGAKVKGEEGDEEAGEGADEDMEGAKGEGREGAKEEPEISRPAQGEVKWWSNVVEVGGLKDKRYNWGGVGSTLSSDTYLGIG